MENANPLGGKYRHSRFNFVFDRPDGSVIVFNTLSKGLVAFDPKSYETFRQLSYGEDDTSDLEDLVENGLVVASEDDELAFLKYHHYKAKFSHDVLRLTIAPTLDCNFACPYCYESRRCGRMDDETQDALIDFIDELTADGVKRIDVSWYGGEPLLFPSIVDNLAMRISAIAKRYGCELSMSMVTNGYLLTPEIVSMMERRGIGRVQITLDGLADHHDLSRPLRDGRGSFDRIVGNLPLFKGSDISVVIRMNLDNNNKGDFPRLIRLIDDLDVPNIETVYPSPVEHINKERDNTVSDYMDFDDFESFVLGDCSGCDDDSPFIEDRVCYCTSETEYCYVIDELGDVYKCWDEVGRKEFRCFNVKDPDDIRLGPIVRYLTDDPFADEKCRECLFLPICFGGCKFQRRILGKSTCGITREILIKQIEFSYLGDSDDDEGRFEHEGSAQGQADEQKVRQDRR